MNRTIVTLTVLMILLLFSACRAKDTDVLYNEGSTKQMDAEITEQPAETSAQDYLVTSESAKRTTTASRTTPTPKGEVYSNAYISFTVPESMKDEFTVEKSGIWINIYESGTHAVNEAGRVVAIAVMDTDYEDILGWSGEICRITKGTEEKTVIAEWPGDDQRAAYYDEAAGYWVMSEDLSRQYEKAKADVAILFDSIVGINGWTCGQIHHPKDPTQNDTSSHTQTSDELWDTLVSRQWVDEDGNTLKITKNITYYKLKPNAIHTDSSYYMGTLSTRNSRGYYYGHYEIGDDNKLRIQFNDWPNGSIGLLNNENYVWDPSLTQENSWCLTAQGTIQFSDGNNEFCNITFYAR